MLGVLLHRYLRPEIEEWADPGDASVATPKRLLVDSSYGVRQLGYAKLIEEVLFRVLALIPGRHGTEAVLSGYISDTAHAPPLRRLSPRATVQENGSTLPTLNTLIGPDIYGAGSEVYKRQRSARMGSVKYP